MSATPITVEDLYNLGWIESPAVHPDGSMIAYVRVSVDRQANRYRRSIWLVATQGGRPRRLTAGLKNDTTPRWSPDGGTIAFVSDRDGLAQIYLIAIDGGEAQKLTSTLYGASEPAWSPDGQQIAFVSKLLPEEATAEEAGQLNQTSKNAWEHKQQSARRSYEEERRLDPRVVQKLPYRSGTTYFDGRKNQIYLITVPNRQDGQDEPGKARRISDGLLHYRSPVWALDQQALYVVAERDSDADTLFGSDDIARMPILTTGYAPIERLTSAAGSYDSPRLAPNGQWLAALRRDRVRTSLRNTALVLLPVAGGAEVDLTSKSDLSVTSFRWGAASDTLFFNASWLGEEPIYRVAINGGAVETAGKPAAARSIAEFDLGGNGTIAFVAGTGSNPCELYCWEANQTEWQLTTISEQLLKKRRLAAFEELFYKAPDGQQVQGWVLYPPDFDPKQQYPLAVHIHGGPHLMWAPGQRSMWHEFQATAARGYITFFCNPRGSDGYGERWRSSVYGSWSAATNDILAGVDLLLARGQIDHKRIAVTGGSYGGYMTAWLISHDQRFVCAVAARGVYDLVSFHGTSDAHELIEFEFDGMPWEQRELLWEQSPLSHAHQITTPLLILHAEQDYRVPISQAEQLFSNLRRRKVAVELVRYPREGHELTRAGEPDHRADHMNRTLHWFDRYCQPAT